MFEVPKLVEVIFGNHIAVILKFVQKTMDSTLSETIQSKPENTITDGCLLPPFIVDTFKREFNTLDKAKNYFLKVIKDSALHSFDGEQHQFISGSRKRCYNSNVDDHLNGTYTRLPKSVESLMDLMFDVNFAKKTIEELNVDMTKICLTRFTLKQIIDAMMVIEEIWHRINGGDAEERFIDLSNSYYTLIPYKGEAPIICTYAQVTAEVRNLKGLFAIVQSYNLIAEEINKKISTIDRYHRLNTQIIPLDRTSFEFQLLEEYAKISNYLPNCEYELQIDDIFKLSRRGEEERFEPFEQLRNRYLLWHGSFLSNFASILRHGLRIAPNDVPRLGKKFGKGLYFADMISKSTKFCVTGEENRAGLILLCEVALGDVDECVETIHNNKANSLYDLPKDKDSVKRIGKKYKTHGRLFQKHSIKYRIYFFIALFIDSCGFALSRVFSA